MGLGQDVRDFKLSRSCLKLSCKNNDRESKKNKSGCQDVFNRVRATNIRKKSKNLACKWSIPDKGSERATKS